MTATAPPPTSTDARTLPDLLLRHARERPRAVALREKRRGVWHETTWSRYAERARHTGLGLAELGVESGDRVAILSENRPEWVVADLGAQGIGAVTVGVYPTSPAAEVEYLLEHSESVVLVAEDEEQLDKALEVRERLPALRRIVVVDPRGVRGLDEDPMLMTFAELEELGAQQDAEEWDRRAAEIDPSATAIVVYTSGTTGPPKGAMISHANLIAAAEAFQAAFDARADDEVLSYLPLCHVAERLFSVIDALGTGYVVNFGEGGESFAQDLRDVQPTIFLGVPRVWEKMLAGIQIRMQDASRTKRAVYRFWVGRGERLAHARMKGRLGPLERVEAALGEAMLFRTLREKLGLQRVRVAISGAAPIAPKVLQFFWALGVPVREGYGQTENTAVCTYMPADDVRIGTVGRPLPGVELRIGEDGEVLTRSAGVFRGYLKNPEATAETVDPDGWLHTGDIGVIDDDGYLTLTDRKKDIIITAGGKNISPSEIENKLKVSPYVREAVVIGDRRKYLVALIGIEEDTVGDWAARRNLPFTTYGDLASKPEVRELIGEWVEEVNSDLAQVETIKKFALLRKELDHEDGELTATQKVKRAAIAQEFADEIEALYG
ncbi:MAG TPA: AMP-binding protein [Solirubrobacteraceae bacterium]|nr:AMP-binding protein [Solirubrobacteraceae bacterium]